MQTLATISFGIGLFVLLFTVIPVAIFIPESLYEILTSDSLRNFFDFIYYFIPFDFCIMCILTIFVFKYSGFFFKLISWVYHAIF